MSRETAKYSRREDQIHQVQIQRINQLSIWEGRRGGGKEMGGGTSGHYATLNEMTRDSGSVQN